MTIKDKRYADLYELQKDIDLGVLTFKTFYEKIEAEYTQHYRESIKKVDNRATCKCKSYKVANFLS